MSKTVKFDVCKDSPMSRSRKIMKKRKRIHFQCNVQRKFKLKTEPYMGALTLKGSNKINVTFSPVGSSVVIRHKHVFANTRNATKDAEHDEIKTSRFLALGNMHRLPTKSQTRREKGGQRTRKGCEGSCLSPLGNGQQCF